MEEKEKTKVSKKLFHLMIQRRLSWPLCKDDMQIRDMFHIKKRGGFTPFIYTFGELCFM